MRHNFDALQAGDFDAALARIDRDWTYVPAPDAHAGVIFRGHDGWHALLKANDWYEAELELDVEVSSLERYVLAAGMISVTTTEGKRSSRPSVTLHAVRDELIWLSRGFSTEHEAVAAARFDANQELALAFDAATDAMALFDDEGRIVHGNRATARLLGLHQDALRGIRIDQFAPPEERDRALSAWKSWKHRGQSAGMAPLVSADGERKLVALTVQTNYAAGRHLVVARQREVGEPASQVDGRLTTRQREVLGLVAAGFTGPEVAERLVIAPATVRTHMRHAMEALGAKTRAEAVAKALASGELYMGEFGGEKPAKEPDPPKSE